MAAERCGDEKLCVFYAELGGKHYAAKPVIAASCRAALGRAAARRGDRAAAVAHWRAACEQLLAARDPLFILRIAEDWGAEEEEPKRLVTQACDLLGMPQEELLRAFGQATAFHVDPAEEERREAKEKETGGKDKEEE